MAMSELHISEDTRIIDICRQMLAIHHALEALTENDPEAPDCGPNHARCEALEEEYAALEAALVRTAPPTTTEGVQALAELAMTYAVRTSEGTLQGPEHFADWLRLFALSCAAGKPETIPLPRCWPDAGLS